MLVGQMQWFNWLAVLVAVAIPLLLIFVFGTSLLTAISTQAIHRWVPATDDIKPRSGREQRYFEDAQQIGLIEFGRYISASVKHDPPTATFLISPDGLSMMQIIKRPGTCEYSYKTRMHDGVWLATYELDKQREASAHYQTAMLLGAKPTSAYLYHNDRIAEYPAEPIPFDPATLLDDIAAHESGRVDDMVQAGLARWRDAERVHWRCTFRGALRFAGRMTRKPNMQPSPERRKHYLQAGKQVNGR